MYSCPIKINEFFKTKIIKLILYRWFLIEIFFRYYVNEIIVVEGINDINILKDLLTESKKIISFDFYAHKSLDELNIKHELVEDYFKPEDIEFIDKKVIDFTSNWYKQPGIAEYITFSRINMGELVEIEIMNYFFLNMKRFLGLTKVVEKESPDRIICGSLSNLVKCIYKEKKIQINKINSKINSGLYFDHIEIPLTLGNKTFTIKTSRKNFLQIKNFIESITKKIFQLNLKNNNKKNILLLDFNVTQYRELLQYLDDKNHNILLLNQRRPAIWNIDSLKIIKKFHGKILKLEDFVKKDKIRKLNDEVDLFLKRLEELWSNDKVFSNYFSINSISFWPGIRDDLIKTLTNRFKECVKTIRLVEQFFEKTEISLIIEWAHNGLEEKIIVELAKRKEIPIVLLQHALYPLDSKLNRYLEFNPIIPQNGIIEVIWGQNFKKYLESQNVQKEKFFMIGSPRHDVFFNKNIQSGNTVIIATNGFHHISFNGNHTLAFQRLEEFIKNIFKELKKYHEKKPIVKLHPSQFYYDPKILINKIDSSIPIFQNINIVNLISSCDFLISLNFSTVILEAMILKKPTILVLPEDQDFEDEKIVKMNSTLCVKKVDDIKNAIEKIVNDKKFREELIKNGTKFVEEYFTNRGNASEEMAKWIKTF